MNDDEGTTSIAEAFLTITRELISEIRWKCYFAIGVTANLVLAAMLQWGTPLGLFFLVGVASMVFVVVSELNRAARLAAEMKKAAQS